MTSISSVYGDSVFDVGANIGNKTAEYLANGVKKVVCFEPQAELVKQLTTRFQEDPRVTILSCGLGKEESEVKLYPCDANTIATMSEKFQTGRFKEQGYTWRDPVSVKVCTAAAMIEKYGCPDFMKIDVEGYEYSVIRGLPKQPLPKTLSFEYSEEFSEEYIKIICLLQLKGYQKFNLSLGESGVFLREWSSAEGLLAFLPTIHRGQYSWGDIYAQL